MKSQPKYCVWAALRLLAGCWLLLAGHFTFAQTPATLSCGQKEAMEALFRARPALRAKQMQIETAVRAQSGRTTLLPDEKPAARILGTGDITLPVVVHIVHNNGPENISDAQVLTAIQHLNEAFANTGYYDPSDGAATGIQFCMAERDTANQPANGITRNVSTYTVMGGPQYYSDDQHVKDLNRWNPSCYVNIWVVASIPGAVAGYAYLPSAHGTDVDGIVVEAGYFGTSYANDVVIAHEMGHYLGLYHTFEGGCTNNDCSVDGDRICDTPPDNSTAAISCGSSMNSCTTDALSGFSSDQSDLTQDYMDYGNLGCMKVFTQDQSDRMNWTIQNVRMSLLHCKSCLPPCPTPVTAGITSPGTTLNAGSSYLFASASANASGYAWYVNGTPVSTAPNLTQTFTPPGVYTVKLVATSANPLCDADSASVTVQAICPVTAAFTKSATTQTAGGTINFTNASTGADAYEWSVNGTAQSAAANFAYTTTVAGQYVITLNAKSVSGNCNQIATDTVYFTCPVTVSFSPASASVAANTALTFTATASGATGYQWLVGGNPAGTSSSLTYNFTTTGTFPVELHATNGVCTSVAYGVVYVADQCGNPVNLFRKTFTPPQGSMFPNDLRLAPDGGAILAGTGAPALLPINIPGLIKVDASGSLQWVRAYSTRNGGGMLSVCPAQDGGYAGVGTQTGPNQQASIVKTDGAGAMVWSRVFDLDGQNTTASVVMQSAEGDFYFAGTATSQNGNISRPLSLLVAKLSAAGVVQWLQMYTMTANVAVSGICDDGTDVAVTGNLTGDKPSGFLVKAAKADGALLLARQYQTNTLGFGRIFNTAGGFFIDAFDASGISATPNRHVLVFTDASGNVTRAFGTVPFAPGTTIGRVNAAPRPDGLVVIQSSPATGGAFQDFVVQLIDPTGGIVVWSKTYGEPNTYLRSIALKPDNSLFLMGQAGIGVFLASVDRNGDGGPCPANPLVLSGGPVTVAVSQLDVTTPKTQASVGEMLSTDITLTETPKCVYVGCTPTVDTCKVCDSFALQGPDSLCTARDSTVFTALRKPNCPLPFRWQLDPVFVDSVRTTDTTIALRVKKTGTFLLIGLLITPCDTLRDTILVHSFVQPDSVRLGPDLALCKASAYPLHAGSGFAHYQWQDGSADSTFTAYFPGIYYVQATDYCGNKFGDTVVITQAPEVPFDAGPDTAICLHDTVQLRTAAGFARYAWGPADYRISDASAQTPRVSPLVDTTYFCTAEKYPGCTVIDSVHITVRQSGPTDFLTPEETLCAGGKTELRPAGSYGSYLWSTGESTASITVNAPGDYILRVTGDGDCPGFDTTSVKVVDCRKGIWFPNSFTPNGDGKNDVFRAIYGEAPETFHLTIFNRWGEKIFETRDPKGAWNGRFNDLPQDSGGFAWYAEYRLAGEKAETFAKGIVVLLR